MADAPSSSSSSSSPHADLAFYFDPVCPFAWMASKWVRVVADQRPLAVDWRFISLRLVNADVDYATHFPRGYEAGHTLGLKLLRVTSWIRSQGDASEDIRHDVGRIYHAYGSAIFESHRGRQEEIQADPRSFVSSVLEQLGLPASAADALDDTAFDAGIQADTDRALELAGKDVGTPIIHFDPPGGAAFFGPVISRLPDPDQAVELWEHITGLARFPGFAELKRSLRETPQLAAFGVNQGDVGGEEDWQKGRRAEAMKR